MILVVDTETTGLCPYKNEPISIAMLALTEALEPADSGINVRIKAIKPDISKKAIEINGLNPAEGSSREDAWAELVEYIRPHRGNEIFFLGHNVKFDIDMMQNNIPTAYSAWFRGTFDHSYLCTLVLSRQYYLNKGVRGRCNLSAMCEHFGITGWEAHDALGDVMRSLALYKKLVNHE